jgi:ubiquitin-protein ligase
MFVHEGPYADAILRFSIHFEMDFPMSNPVIKFGPDVYHCSYLLKSSTLGMAEDLVMIDPKTLVWSPRGDLSVWR